jgi:hypothetical protein
VLQFLSYAKPSDRRLLVTASVIPMKNGVFWVLTRATRRNNPEDTILHSHRLENLKSYSVIPSSPILVTLMMEALSFSETSVLTRSTWHNIPEDAILHSILVRVSKCRRTKWSEHVTSVRDTRITLKSAHETSKKRNLAL